MRLIALCLLGLFALAMTTPVAEASSQRGTSRGAAKVMKPAAAPARSATIGRPQLATGAAEPRRQLVARVTTSRQTAKASSRVAQRNGYASGGAVVAQRSGAMTARGARLTSWQAGLPAASGEQRDCPVGTMSTLARGHDDVVRCMPL
jgi:hypothetical protein